MMLLCKVNPVEGFQMFFNGIFGNASSFVEIFVKATPLILTGLGCAVAFSTDFLISAPKVSFTSVHCSGSGIKSYRRSGTCKNYTFDAGRFYMRRPLGAYCSNF